MKRHNAELDWKSLVKKLEDKVDALEREYDWADSEGYKNRLITEIVKSREAIAAIKDALWGIEL